MFIALDVLNIYVHSWTFWAASSLCVDAGATLVGSKLQRGDSGDIDIAYPKVFGS